MYSLIVEEGTPFYDRYEDDVLLREQGKLPVYLPDEEAERGMYAMRKRCLGLPGMGMMRFPTMRSRALCAATTTTAG